MVFQYFDDVCESVNLTTVYSANPSFGEKNLDWRMLVKTDSGEEGCHEWVQVRGARQHLVSDGIANFSTAACES